MKDKSKDFLLFYDWFKILDRMSHKNMHLLLRAMVLYQAEGIEPPEFPLAIRDAAELIFDQLRRRKESSEYGKQGRAKQLMQSGDQSTPKRASMGTPEPTPAAQDKGKTETKQDGKQDGKYLLSDESAYLCGSYEPQIANGKLQMENEDAEARNARGEMENGKLQMENEDIGLRTYGIHNNVLLSESEYNMLRRDIPNADEYINIFSDKLVKKGYRYRDHYIAIRTWWERDKQYLNSEPLRADNGRFGPPLTACEGAINSTFLTDEFFEAALRRSEEELNKY